MFWIKKSNYKYASRYQLCYRIEHNFILIIYCVYDRTDDKLIVGRQPCDHATKLSVYYQCYAYYIIYKYILIIYSVYDGRDDKLMVGRRPCDHATKLCV